MEGGGAAGSARSQRHFRQRLTRDGHLGVFGSAGAAAIGWDGRGIVVVKTGGSQIVIFFQFFFFTKKGPSVAEK